MKKQICLIPTFIAGMTLIACGGSKPKPKPDPTEGLKLLLILKL